MDLITIIVLSVSFILLLFSSCLILIFLDNYQLMWQTPKANKKRFITAIIPAFNEEKYIEKTVLSVYDQEYDKRFFEIIVVNDGSTDNTKKICQRLEKKGIIKLLNKKNGGKASAINHGLKQAKGELVFTLDADSYADKNCFNNLVGYFNDSKVAAVSSSMKVVDSKGLFRKMQWLEYSFSIMMRKVQSLFNALYVTPGPGSMYRRAVLAEVGGFKETVLTEDMEIAFNIQNHNYLIEHSLTSLVYTNTPPTFMGLFKQRKRWYTGSIEDALSYKHFFLNKSKGMLGCFLLPINWISIFSVVGLSIYYSLKFVDFLFSKFLEFKLINFEILYTKLDLSFIFFNIQYVSIILLCLGIYSTIVLYFSLKVCDERTELRNNAGYFFFYLFFYSTFQSLFWIVSFINKLIFRRNNMVGWKQ